MVCGTHVHTYIYIYIYIYIYNMKYKVAPNTPNTRGGTWLIKWLNDQFPSLVAIIYIQWIGAIMKYATQIISWGCSHQVKQLVPFCVRRQSLQSPHQKSSLAMQSQG